MPTISVGRDALFEALGRTYSAKEFDELCFDFGLELDEDASQPLGEEIKIEVAANRYDLLCFEGIQLMLNIFNGRCTSPQYALKIPVGGQLESLTAHQSTEQIRPYISGAILRNIKFTKARYDSFITLQDKLHQNLARQRTLVAIGTHDLDTIQGPFTYEALPPDEISFAPLNQTRSMNGHEIMKFYEKDKHLSRYLPIIRDSPVYPVILDSKRRVCSMPPIINSNHSKITLNTRNIFMDVTATDKTKAEICNNIIVTMFSQYTDEPFTVEPINIHSPHNNQSRQVPDLTPREIQASTSYINSCCGLSLSKQEICSLLSRMSFAARPSLPPSQTPSSPSHNRRRSSATPKSIPKPEQPSSSDLLLVSIPPTRADILHQCDIMEDVAIAYGFNRLPRYFPSVSSTIAAPLPINKLSDILRLEAAMAGWKEVMPLTLCSHDENFKFLNRTDDGSQVVTLANPKTAEYQVVRTSLLPGLLKTIRENRHVGVPIKVFEVGDVVYKAPHLERKCRNERHFAAAYCGKTSGFEIVHGLLDRLMLMLRCAFGAGEAGLDVPVGKKSNSQAKYWIEEVEDPTFFPAHAASIHLQLTDSNNKKTTTTKIIGVFGIVHPSVLEQFELKYPVSTVEFNAEVFL